MNMTFLCARALFVLLYFVFVAESAKLSGCGSYVEEWDDPDVVCNIEGTSNVNWTLVNEEGVTRYLGSCLAAYGCSSPYDSSTLRLYLSTSQNSIHFSNILGEFSGNLTCQEIMTNGTVDSDTCELNVMRAKITTTDDFQEGSSANLYCYTSPFAPSTVTWSLTTDAGQTLDLGNCTDVYRCSSPHSPSISLTRPGSYYSKVDFSNINRTLEGELSCSYTYGGLTETSSTTLNIYRVKMTTTAELREGSSAYLTCYTSLLTPNTVTWALTTDAGHTLDLGNCTDVYRCSSLHSPSISLQRSTNSYNKVYFSNINRTLEGELSCSYTYGGLTETSSTTLIVNHRPRTLNCGVDISRHDWSGVLSCNITDVYSSAGLYDFQVRQSSTVLREELTSYGVMFDGRRSYRDGLTSYVKTTNNQVYYNGSLTYSWNLPAIPRLYTRFDVEVYYGQTVFQRYYINRYINVAPPSQPSHNCSGLNYIPQTGVVPCVCTTDYLGFPAGRLVWLLGNVPIATGDYGVTQLTFPSGQVSRQHDRMMVTCQLDWVQPMTTVLSSHVAYGPDTVTLQLIAYWGTNNNYEVNVISHVTGMKPMKADMVQWGGLCQGQQGFTCTLTPRSAAEVDGKTVTCRVTNAANNGHSAEASVVISLSVQPRDAALGQTAGESEGLNWLAVALGITLGVVVIAFVVVMIILYRRRPLSSKGDNPNRPKNANESDSTSFNLDEMNQNRRTPQGVTCPSAVYQGEN